MDSESKKSLDITCLAFPPRLVTERIVAPLAGLRFIPAHRKDGKSQKAQREPNREKHQHSRGNPQHHAEDCARYQAGHEFVVVHAHLSSSRGEGKLFTGHEAKHLKMRSRKAVPVSSYAAASLAAASAPREPFARHQVLCTAPAAANRKW